MSPSDRPWAVIVGIASAVLLGYGLGDFRPRPDPGIPPDTGVPELLEPRRLDLSEPPRVFRWEPGGDDVQLSQLLLMDGELNRVWESAPIGPGVSELEVSPGVFDGVPAGSQVFWRLREVRDGKPRAASPIAEFMFLVDNRGYGPGEAPVTEYVK